MVGTGRDIFLIPVRERYLLHAPLQGLTALLNAAAAEQLQGILEGEGPSSVDLSLQPLADRLLKEPARTLKPQEGPFAPRQLCLLLTNDCNLRCLYCAPAAGEAASLTMSRDICAAALAFFADVVARDKLPSYTLYFHGGEPFLRWDLMQFCIAEAERHAERLGVPFGASATTNAFLSAERAAWVAEHFDFAIVSLDGPPTLHDHFRPTISGQGSFEVVARTVKIFEDRGLDFGLRCTVERRTAALIPEIAEFFCHQFRPSVINFEPLVVSGRCAENNLEPPEAEEFIRGVIRAGSIARAQGIELMLTTAQTRRLARSNCEVAQDLCVVTPDGLISTCFGAHDRTSPHVDPFVIGEYDEAVGRFRIDEERLRTVRTFGVENIPRCRDCFCKWHCSGGCRIFHTPAFCDEPPVPLCEMTQKLTLWQLLCDLGFEEEAEALIEAA